MTAKEKFIETVSKNIKRAGINHLMEWLETTDFYSAPASTKFHGSHEGGLVEHSANVYTELVKLAEVYGLGPDNGINNPDESMAIVALFHDLCKADYYSIEMRWRKDKNDKWEQYPVYSIKEKFAYGGHGSKSVYLVQNFMALTPEEASAINCHMGQFDATTYSNPSPVYERNLLAWLLHVADEAATYVIENKEGTENG